MAKIEVILLRYTLFVTIRLKQLNNLTNLLIKLFIIIVCLKNFLDNNSNI